MPVENHLQQHKNSHFKGILKASTLDFFQCERLWSLLTLLMFYPKCQIIKNYYFY